MSLTARISRPRALAQPPRQSGLTAVQGTAGLPVIGTSLTLVRDPLPWWLQQYTRYGPVTWTRAFGTRLVMLTGPDALAEVLTNPHKAYASGEGWEYFIGPFFHRGLMLLDFAEHLDHRRVMQGAFTRDQLAGYLTALNAGITQGLAGWRPGPDFRVLPAMKQLTLDLATEVFLGLRLGAEADRVSRAFIDTVRAGPAVIRFPLPLSRWSAGLRGRRTLEDFFARKLPEKRAGTGEDLFSVLCRLRTDDGLRFTDDDVINHMVFLLMAAHDTVKITLTAMLYYLARHPEWQDRAREESRAVGTPVLGYADLDRLVAVDLVMKEALRLHTPVPVLMRRAVRDTELLGHHVAAGTRLVLGLHATHRLSEYWPDPERFDPGRFAEDRREDKVHPLAWAPFGGGVHKCIGQRFAGLQIKAVLHQLLLRHRWSVPPGYTMPVDMSTLPIPRDGLPVRLEHA
ncbi:cytochrome P450 [Streptomyces sp. LX-29]|uniref:cytochrome P450 n=1 Tax=Streptomyces sp. LX-29 TaxID=2900152 RepID=UPI00240E0613|nr:cytochrome P450 [Streptomyces sp. LX-29]WFB10937.1 cytochrome P450 [Streptomyces sp. LX-29]